MINKIEVADEKELAIFNKWKEITGKDTPPSVDQERLGRFCYMYKHVNGSYPMEEIENKIKSCMQYLLMETKIAEHEKTNAA